MLFGPSVVAIIISADAGGYVNAFLFQVVGYIVYAKDIIRRQSGWFK